MRPIYIIFTLCLLTASGLRGQGDRGRIVVTDPQVTLSDSTVRLSFTIEAGKKSTRHGTTAVYAPHISDGENTVSFRPVVVTGRRASVAWKRHAWAAGSDETYNDALMMKKGEAAEYVSEVPFQWWMHGATVSAEKLLAGCCASIVETSVVTPYVLPAAEPAARPRPVIETVELVPDLSVADTIARIFHFVLPASEFDEENPFRLYDDERDNALTIYFHINSYDIDPAYSDNRLTLSNLLASIEIIRESVEAEVSRVVVAGFASPDGPFEYNDRLAWERAVSVKEYIMKNSGLADELISLYNGSADWQGLRLLIQHDRTMPGRDEVLDIIDNTPIWDALSNTGRNTRLRQLHGGGVYDYMAAHIFPKLRNGAFIRVYYDNNAD